MAKPSSRFAKLLRSWRARRGLSQQVLAARVGISQRHVSFLETGRSQPSAAMIERLSTTLALDHADTIALFASAGLSLPDRDRGRSDAEQSTLASVLQTVIDMHVPYPALVMDRCWNVRQANAVADRLFSLVLPIAPGHRRNAIEMCFTPNARSVIANWVELARMLLARVRRELTRTDDEGLRTMLVRLEQLPAVAALSSSEPEHDRSVSRLPVFPIDVRIGDQEAKLFSVVAAVGTSGDAELDDVRLELYYPADTETRRWLEALALLPAR